MFKHITHGQTNFKNKKRQNSTLITHLSNHHYTHTINSNKSPQKSSKEFNKCIYGSLYAL